MKLTADLYRDVRAQLAALGYASDWEWAQDVRPPETPEALVAEYAWVVINSGMKSTVARKIMDRVWPAVISGISLNTYLHGSKIFGHCSKSVAIEDTWQRRSEHFAAFRAAADVLAWCESLPWIGPITKFHLAKNLGADVAKPDRWLVRLAAAEATTVDELCARLAAETGDRIATVDVVLWRACAVGVLSVLDGEISFTAAGVTKP